jgi:hypothetical protein
MTASNLPTTVAIPTADPTLVRGIDTVLEVARELRIDTRDMYEVAAGELREIVGRKKRLEDSRKAIKAPVLEAGRAIDAFFGPLIETLEQAEGVYKRGMIAFDNAERARQAEEERKAREAAEAERRRIEEEALKRAQELEAQRKAEAAALAEELRAEGDEEAAKEIVEQAQQQAAAEVDEVIQSAAVEAQTVIHIAPIAIPVRAAGTMRRENWKGRVTDAKALIAAAAGGNALALAIVIRALEESGAKVVSAQARSLKSELNSVPGVESFDEGSLAVRGVI